MATTLERFKEVLKPIVNVEATEATTLRSMCLDPLDLMHLITDLEEEFAVAIDDDAAEGFKTAGEVVRHLDGLVAGKGQS